VPTVGGRLEKAATLRKMNARANWIERQLAKGWTLAEFVAHARRMDPEVADEIVRVAAMMNLELAA